MGLHQSLTLVAALAMAGCVRPSAPDCSPDRYTDWDQEYRGAVVTYPMHFDKRTPLGAWVDTSGTAVDLDAIDDMTLETANCLRTEIVSCSLRVKVAPDYKTTEGVQWFPCLQPNGMRKCTGVVQFPSIVVTTPNLASYRHELVHNVTHATEGDIRIGRCEHGYSAPELDESSEIVPMRQAEENESPEP